MKTWKIVLLIMGALLAAGAVYATILARRGFSARENPSWVEAFAAGIAKSLAVPATYRLKNPYPPTAENLREGEEHFADHCAICHGNDGGGDSLFRKGLYPKPPDIRTEGTQNNSAGALCFTILTGRRLDCIRPVGAA